MYLAYCCEYNSGSWSNTIFYNSATEMESRAMLAGKVDYELGKAGSFTFTLPLTNTNAEIFNRLTSFVDVKRSDETDYIFSGRVFDISKNFDDSYTITCEGLLALLNDVQIGPKVYKDSLSAVVTNIINDYNSSAATQNQITLRNFNIDPNNEIKINKFCSDYESALSRLIDLVDEYGGYLQVIKSGTTSPIFYLDWLDEDQASVGNQSIDFGENLLDLTQTESNTEDIITVLIPLGADLTTGDRAITIQTEKSDMAFGRYLQLNVQEKEYSKSNNTSTIEWTLRVVDGSEDGGQNFDTYAKVTIGNQIVYNQRKGYYDYEFPALAEIEYIRSTDSSGNEVIVDKVYHDSTSGTLVITHNQDGSKNLPISLDYNIYGMTEDNVVRGVVSLTNLSSTVTGNSVSGTCAAGLNGRCYKLTVKEESYSVTNNSSVVSWKVEGLNAKTEDILAEIAVYIGGQTVYQVTGADSWTNWQFPSYLAKQSSVSGTITVQHDPDGTKVFDNNIIIYTNVCTSADGQSYLESSRNLSLTLTALGSKPAIQSTLDTKLTIENATNSNGLKYIENATGISRFGKIIGTHTWSDINDPDELYETASAYLTECCKPLVEIELSTVDLSMVDSSVPRFKIGTKVLVNSKAHGIVNEYFLVRKQSINLIDPVQDRMTIGEVVEGYIRKNRKLINYFQKASFQQNILNQISVNPEFKSALASNLDSALMSNGYLKASEFDIAATKAGYVKDGYLKLYYLDADNIEAKYATINVLESDYIMTQNLDAAVANIGYLKTSELDAEVANLTYVKAGDISANYVSVDTLNARVANLGYVTATEVEADYVKAEDLEADVITAGFIKAEDVESDYVRVDNLNASVANLGYAKTSVIDATYAHIDLANVNNAWIENGVIKNGAIGNAQIADVSANKITAGTLDASRITVTNLNAASITTGSLTVGGLTINVTADTATLDGSSIEDGTITLSGLAQEVVDKIDGAIETFTGTVIPTLSNYPASSWTTNDIKSSHVGDVYYVINNDSQADGYCYRFAYDNNTSTYGWVLIKDSDVTRALQDLIDVQGDISGLQTFESETTTWIAETDGELTRLSTRTTTLETNGVKSTTQLWYTKANTTAPSAPSAHVTNSSTNGGAWTTAVPAYNASYPNYFYCWEYQYVDNSYGWSAVIRDIAMGETQAQARTAQSTANANIKSSTMLWYTKANTTPPSKPTQHVTSTATTGNGWRIVVPTYNSTYPYYFYCYEYLHGDSTTYSWSDVVYDRATSESQSVARAASSSLANYISTNDSAIQSLQDQIDEQLDIWYYEVDPTTSNAPASSWNTTDLKDNHVGDLYYNTTNGHSWRWVKDGSTYSWVAIPDSDAAAALAAANDAKAVADGKRRVFTSTPTVPYDIGDLWVNGSVVKYATVARDSSGTYTASDWSLTATDDTAANAAQSTANANIKSSTMLWYTKANTTPPSKPTQHVTSTATTGNGWRIVVPTYNSTYPYYFYCYEYLHGDSTTYSWSDVVYDRATSEAQANSKNALDGLSTKVESSVFTQLSSTVDSNSASITSLSNTMQTKADSSTVTTLSNTVNSVQQTANSNSSYIGNLTTTLGTNADGTTAANDIVHKFSSLDQDLDGFKMTVGSTYQTLSASSAFNLIPIVYQTESEEGNTYEANGITWTLNRDGSVAANGTATGDSYWRFSGYEGDNVPPVLIDSSKQYRLSGCPSGGSASTYYLSVRVFTANENPTSSNGTLYIDGGTGVTTQDGYRYASIFAGVANGTTCNNIIFYPMFEVGTTTHEYVSTRNYAYEKANNAQESIDAQLDNISSALTKAIDLEATIEGFKSTVSETYVTTSDYSQQISLLQTAITQTSSEINLTFENVNSTIDTLSNDVQDAIAISKSITFDNGDLLLTRTDSQNNVKLTTDTLQFNYGKETVAQICQDDGESLIQITNAYIGTSLKIGNFEFIPRATGNLSFRKRN